MVNTWLAYLTKLDGRTSHELWVRQHNVSYVIQPGHKQIGILKIKLTWWYHVWRWCLHGTLQVTAKFLYFSGWLYPPKPNKQFKLQTGICTTIIFQAVIWIAPISIVGNFATDWTWGETRYKIWYSPQQRIYCTVVVDTICTYGIYHNCAKYKCNKPRYLHTHYPT